MTKFEYDWLWENLPELCPKSLSGYIRMKNSNSANFQKIVAAAREKGFDIINIYLPPQAIMNVLGKYK